MIKPKRDPEKELRNRKIILFLMTGVPLSIALLVVLYIGFRMVVDFYHYEWLPSSVEAKMICVGLPIFILAVLSLSVIYQYNVNRVDELEKLVESGEINHE